MPLYKESKELMNTEDLLEQELKEPIMKINPLNPIEINESQHEIKENIGKILKDWQKKVQPREVNIPIKIKLTESPDKFQVSFEENEKEEEEKLKWIKSNFENKSYSSENSSYEGYVEYKSSESNQSNRKRSLSWMNSDNFVKDHKHLRSKDSYSCTRSQKSSQKNESDDENSLSFSYHSYSSSSDSDSDNKMDKGAPLKREKNK